MARARNIKPGFYNNEDLAECSIWARYIFPGLWMLADREGRLEDRPKRIKGELLPFDGQDVEPLLAELEAREFLVRYQNSDGRFIQISKFSTHQAPHYSEKQSVIKPPDSGNVPVINPPQTPESSGSEPHIKRGSQPPDSLIPDSLIPDKPIVGLAPDATQPDRKILRQQAVEVIEFLNGKAGKHYQPVKQNVDLIVSLLGQGVKPEDLRAVVAKKCREWKGKPDMELYLRPATLFGPKNFHSKYAGEIPPAESPQ